MGTRSGDIDPAVVFHLMEAGLPVDEIRDGLERQGGLVGLSGVSPDFRRVASRARSGNEAAVLALEVFVHRIRRYLGAFLVQAGPCNGVVFSGGIGENSHEVRSLVLDGMEHVGLVLDPGKNRETGERSISAAGKPCRHLGHPHRRGVPDCPGHRSSCHEPHCLI